MWTESLDPLYVVKSGNVSHKQKQTDWKLSVLNKEMLYFIIQEFWRQEAKVSSNIQIC